MYTITVKLPEENRFFESEMRDFMTKYIFSRGMSFAIEEKKSEIPEIINPEEEK